MATGELPKADQLWQEYMQAYPRDHFPPANLGYDRAIEGNYAEAVELSGQGLCITANDVETYEDHGACLMALGRFEEARKTFEEALSHKLDDDNLHMGLYGLAFLAGDMQGMAKQVAELDSKPWQNEILSAEADTGAYGGHLGERAG